MVEDDVSDDKTDIAVPDVEEENVSLQEEVSPDGEILRELRGAGEVLTRVELDLAYSSEKLLNLDIFLMHVVDRENDYETSAMENEEEISDDSVQKALEFNFLAGILDSEVRELEKLMASLQPEIVDFREKISSCGHSKETFNELERKLHDSEESLEQSQNQVAEIRMQCDKFQRTLHAICGQEDGNDSKEGEFPDNDHFSNRNAKIKMQTSEQQRHILRMLEKSLARELDLEKKLSDSRNGEEDLNEKLHSAEQEMFCMDEAVEDVFWRLFEAENAAEVLMGISKEMMGRLQIILFNLNGSIQREGEMKSKLQDLMKPMEKESGLSKLETGCETPDDVVKTKLDTIKSNLQEDGRDTHNSSEVITLKEKVQSLELQLKECEGQLQCAKDSVVENQKQQTVLTSRLSEMNNIIEDLNENMSKAESRAETAETKCSLLAETNLMLTEELGLLKGGDIGIEKVNLLEKQLRESDNQLQHAKASVEASQEQQNMLYSAIADMENLINDLKSKVVKAENRAEKSDTKCAILSETNLELNEEVSFLRSRMECLETSLCQADEERTATAKEINKRAKVITDMVMQLALERERLHKQMSLLSKENKMLAANFRKGCEDNIDKENYGNVNMASDIGTKEPEEAVTEFSATSFQVNKSEKDAPTGKTEVEPTVSAEDASLGGANHASVERIERRHLSTYFLIPIVVLLFSVIAVYLFHPDRYQL